MTRVTRWTVPALFALVPLGVGLRVIAQSAGGRQSGEVDQAKEKVALIEQGQLNLADATKIAEKHVKGNALRANCEIRPGEAKPGDRARPGGPSGGEAGPDDMRRAQPAGNRLVYDIVCFVNEEVKTVQVDGLTKKVIEGDKGTASPARPDKP